MKLSYGLTIEQTQKLTMTPELIQAIRILQFNTQELDNFVQGELLENPVLEYDRTADIEPPKEKPDFDLREKIKEDYDDISGSIPKIRRLFLSSSSSAGMKLWKTLYCCS